MTLLDLPHVSKIESARLSSTRPVSTAIWHVAVTRPGMFPMHEARCPCEKAPCGLVIPRPDVECEVHTPAASLRQVHSPDECRTMRNAKHGRRRRGIFRRS